MNIWFGLNAPFSARHSAVTIGNFDGVHSGHRHILQHLAQRARQRSLNSTAIIFEPQPAEWFSRLSGKPKPCRITPLREKLALLRQSGCLNAVWVLRFNPHLAGMDAEQFIQTVLRRHLDTRYILVGDDFRFGSGRSGGFELLAAQTDFAAERMPTVLAEGSRASSTAVRQALAAGNLAAAERILAHPYTLSGRVKHGQKLGRTIGCPTANIHLPPHDYALGGVFAVEVSGSFGTRRGAASFGRNPTVSDSPRSKLEVHLLDFSGSLYGQRLTVRFLHKLRDEIKFGSLNALQEQIAADIAAVRAWQQ